MLFKNKHGEKKNLKSISDLLPHVEFYSILQKNLDSEELEYFYSHIFFWTNVINILDEHLEGDEYLIFNIFFDEFKAFCRLNFYNDCF